MKRFKKLRSIASNLCDRLFSEPQARTARHQLTSRQGNNDFVLLQLEVDAMHRVITRMENRVRKLEISNKCHRAELEKCKTRLNAQQQIISAFKMSIINPSLN